MRDNGFGSRYLYLYNSTLASGSTDRKVYKTHPVVSGTTKMTIHTFSGATAKVRYTLTVPDAGYWGAATKMLTERTLTCTGYNRRSNGLVDFYFTAPNEQASELSAAIANALAVGNYDISMAATFAINGTGGTDYKAVGGAYSIGIGSPVYAYPEVLSVSGTPTVDWNRTVGATTTTINPVVRQLKLTFTVNMHFVDAYNRQGETVRYLTTYYDDLGQEGLPSPITITHDLFPGDYIKVAALSESQPSFPSSDTTIVGRRIYRTAAGKGIEEDNFYFVDQQALSGTSPSKTTGDYYDYKNSSELSEPLEIVENPGVMTSVYTHPGGFMVGFHKKDIWFSEVFKPYTWPSKYQLTIDYNIVGIGISGNDIYVLTEGDPYVCTGDDPATMSVRKIHAKFNQSCVGRKSIVRLGDQGVGYAAPGGYCVIRGGVNTMLTESFYSETQWAALSPSTFACAVRNNTIHCFSTTACIMLDLTGNQLNVTTATVGSSHSGSAQAYVDPISNTLYMARGGYVHVWEGSTSYLTATWRSKKYTYSRDEGFVVARVRSDVYTNKTITLNAYLNGALVDTRSMSSAVDVRLPLALATGFQWEFEIQIADNAAGQNAKVFELLEVSKVIAALSDALTAKRDSDRDTWKGFVMMGPMRKTFTAARVRATSYTTRPVLRIYSGEPLAQVHEVEAIDGQAFRLPKLQPDRMWGFDVEYADDVFEVSLSGSMGGLKA